MLFGRAVMYIKHFYKLNKNVTSHAFILVYPLSKCPPS